MAGYVEINGVHTWYDDRGAGDPLVLLHGGLTDARDFAGNLDRLTDRFRLLLPERRGHGHTADVPGPITVEAMARDTIAFVERIAGGPVRLAGYSAGAIVALWVAARRPDLIERLVLISGAFRPEGMILRPTADAPPPAPLLAAYAEVSPDGAGHFPVVQAKIVRSIAEEPGLDPGELSAVTCPALVVAADDDIVTLAHTLELYRNLGDAQLAVIPGTSHLLLREKPGLCAELVTDFLTSGRVSTWMPIRRAPVQRGLPDGLSKPALRALAAAGYTTLDQLVDVSQAELDRLHGVGPKAIDLLRQALAEVGLSFSGEELTELRFPVVADDGSRPARVEDVHELALAMPHVTVYPGTGDRPVYQVGGKSFVFFRNPRPDAVDPATGERYADVIVFWVATEADKQALVQDETSPFFTTAHFNGHLSVLLRGSRAGELVRDELAEVVQEAWLSRASARRGKAWLNEHRLS